MKRFHLFIFLALSCFKTNTAFHHQNINCLMPGQGSAINEASST